MGKIVRLLQADDGAAAIEYGLLGALIGGALLIGLSALSSSLDQKLSQLGSDMAAAQSSSSSGSGSGSGSGGGNNGNNGKGGKGGNGKGNNGNGKGNGGSSA